ncbi:MAG: HEPN domain-containing protein, partial [bacterium]|nr:HEPN domain-containing protein [bacterium]
KIDLEISEDNKKLLAEISSFYISGRYPNYKIKISSLLNKKKAKEYFTQSKELLKWMKKTFQG